MGEKKKDESDYSIEKREKRERKTMTERVQYVYKKERERAPFIYASTSKKD
jgi:hypothetical protein